MDRKSVGTRIAEALLRDWEERSARRKPTWLGLSVFQRVHNIVFAGNLCVIAWFSVRAFWLGKGWSLAGWFFVGFFISTLLDAVVVCGEDWLREISREQYDQDSQKNCPHDLAPVGTDLVGDGENKASRPAPPSLQSSDHRAEFSALNLGRLAAQPSPNALPDSSPKIVFEPGQRLSHFFLPDGRAIPVEREGITDGALLVLMLAIGLGFVLGRAFA